MFAKNLTSKVQEVRVQEFGTPIREYCIYLEPNGCTELVGLLVTNKKELKGLVDFEKKVVSEEPRISVDVHPVIIKEEIAEASTEGAADSTEAEVLESKFICDECGAEFASSRGLASHKARVHENQ